MLQRYPLKCKCGNQMLIEVDENVSFRGFCFKCRLLVLDRTTVQTSASENTKKATTRQPNLITIPEEEAPEVIEVEEIAEPKQKIDHYSVLKTLGAGAMGKVFLAVDDKTGEQVALKLLNKNSDELMLEYFIREAQLLESLKHPNIINLKKCGYFEGASYIAMEYVAGNTLEEFLKKGPIAPRYAIKIILDVLDALVYAAEKHHIIHRDIKPSNVLISKDKVVKVIDFGIGKELEETSALTKTGQMIGTAYYMPPEQLQEAKRADYRADVYSVGATLFHSLCGHAPFEEQGKNMLKILMAKHQNSYVHLAQLNPQLPKELIALVEKAMEHNPDNRYENAHEMKDALSKIHQKYYMT